MDLIDFCSDTASDEVFAQEYKDYFYVDNLADYAVFTMALNVGDNAYKNTFLSVVDISKGHRYLLTPWDMDQSLGGHWNGDYDIICCVKSERATQLSRMQTTRGHTREEAEERIGAQMPVAEKAEKSHSVIANDGSCEDLRKAVSEFARWLAKQQ